MLFLIDMPLPSHGMSNINKIMYQMVRRLGISTRLINSCPSFAAKTFNTKFWIIIKILYFPIIFIRLIYIFKRYHEQQLYRSINGGYGKFFDFFYLVIGNYYAKKIFIHHHSFDYINKKSKLFSVIEKIINKKTVHIVLSDSMATKLSTLYNINVKNIRVISNSSFFSEIDSKGKDLIRYPHDDKMIKLGYLANISIPKGIDLFLETCNYLASKKILIEANIAGPFTNNAVEKIVKNAVTKASYIQYFGPLFDEQKKKFFEGIDFFIFPSKYKNEAEPLVIYEAAQQGAIIIASDVGCIPDILSSLDGITLSLDENFVCEVEKFILSFTANKLFMKHNDQVKKFQQLSLLNKARLKDLLEEFSSV